MKLPEVLRLPAQSVEKVQLQLGFFDRLNRASNA